jgi:GTP-binding protein
MGIVVAIDGPSGAGKSSTSKAIAIRAGWNYLDTGALYRAVTWVALENNCIEAAEILKALKSAPIRFVSDPNSPDVFAGDTQITHAIRGTSVTENVSRISAMPQIREELLVIQRKIISQAPRGIVVEGRDIGTVVVPDAALKIYLTADLDARAYRRENETEDKSVDVKSSLENRDSIDSTRTVSPASAAPRAMADSKIQGWRRSSERSLPSFKRSVFMSRIVGAFVMPVLSPFDRDHGRHRLVRPPFWHPASGPLAVLPGGELHRRPWPNAGNQAGYRSVWW